MTEPCDLSAVEARRLIGLKRLSPVELLESCLARIAAVNPALTAIVTLDEEMGRQAARAAEDAVMAGGPLGPLHGLPVALKDDWAAKGLRTTCGSLIFEDHVPEADDPGTARLRAAGAVIFAKTNMPEFGAGANTTNRVFGPTRNPFDPKLTPGGSSGGTAAALATGMVPLATGSDYGGSVRTPAAFCGVTGFRPSLGVCPHTGSAAVLSPFGVKGPMARDLADAHLLLQAMVGHDPRDPHSHPTAARVAEPLAEPDLATLRVAISPDFGAVPMAAEGARLFERRVTGLAGLFGRLAPAHPDMGPVHEVFEILRGVAFLASHRGHLETSRDKLDRNVIDNCERGLGYSLGDVAWAQAEQTALYRRWLAFFEEWDLLLCPAASVAPFPVEELFVEAIDGQPMPTYMRWLAISYAPTMAFACAAAIPFGLCTRGLPFGLQIAGPPGADAKVLAAARAIERTLAESPETGRPRPDLAALAGAAP